MTKLLYSISSVLKRLVMDVAGDRRGRFRRLIMFLWLNSTPANGNTTSRG